MIMTPEEYNALGYVAECDDTEKLSLCLSRAEILMDTLSDGGCSSYDSLNDVQKEKLKSAVSFQTEYFLQNGIEDNTDESTRVSIGDFSYTTENCETKKPYGNISSMAILLLKQGGLFYRGCEARG